LPDGPDLSKETVIGVGVGSSSTQAYTLSDNVESPLVSFDSVLGARPTEEQKKSIEGTESMKAKLDEAWIKILKPLKKDTKSTVMIFNAIKYMIKGKLGELLSTPGPASSGAELKKALGNVTGGAEDKYQAQFLSSLFTALKDLDLPAFIETRNSMFPVGPKWTAAVVAKAAGATNEKRASALAIGGAARKYRDVQRKRLAGTSVATRGRLSTIRND